MQFISCHNGKLQTLETAGLKISKTRSFTTGLAELDALAPEQSLARGAVHELLFDDHTEPKFAAAVFAHAASILLPLPSGEGWGKGEHQELLPIIWSDPTSEIYPSAFSTLGFDLAKLYLLHTSSDADQSWAITEALRCPGVAAVVASPRRLSRIEARRLQLAAERGGGVGILMRPRDRNSLIYAAATRWLVSPYPGERTVQRWKIQLLHGHGGRIGQAVFLEFCRETHSLRATEKLPDRQTAPATAPQRIVA